MDLKKLVKTLESYAPLHTACDWDNVGLIVEPSDLTTIKKVLITTDLTEPVFAECIEKKVDLIISYHPSIAKPLKRLTQSEWEQRCIVKCIENKMALYNPHTSWDNKFGGINDWIMDAFETTKVESVESNSDKVNPCGFSKSLRINLPNNENLSKFLLKIKKLTNINYISQNEIYSNDSTDKVECEFLTSDKGVLKFIDLLEADYNSNVLSTIRLNEIKKPLMKNVGLGRLGTLVKPIKISDLVNRVKNYLNMKTFRLALANGKDLDDYVSTIAVGAGCCSDLLNDVKADFIITGEFLHEEILHECSRGISMILTDHSNTERGYQQIFKKRLIDALGSSNQSIEIIVSSVDRDPLEYK